MKTVLAPIDFSEISDRVVSEAITLARAIGARLVLLHVPPPLPSIGAAPDLAAVAEDFTVAAEEEVARRLSNWQRSLRDRGVTAHAVQVPGDPRVRIVEQAVRLSADYIVMGSHGHSAFYDLLVGSTAGGVLRRALCQVMIVPANLRSGRRSRAAALK